MKNVLAYKKVNQVILSCENKEQLKSASNMVVSFSKLYGDSELTKVLSILLERKLYFIEMKTKPVVYFLVGPPGIGKSTYVKNVLLPNGDYHVASTDDILTKKGKEIGLNYNQAFDHFDFKDFKDIEKIFRFGIMRAINERLDIVIDRTNMTLKGRNKLLRLFPDDYIKIAVVFDFSNAEKLKAQLAKREKEEGKVISDSVMYKMIKSYVEPTNKEFDQIIKL